LEETSAEHPQLEYEHRIYKQLAADGSPWLPKIYWFGVSGDYRALVMELLGPSLEHLHSQGQLSLEQVLYLAPKMLQRLELVHTAVVHRDIKPDNFVMGLGERADSVYLIDFGLSKCYRRAGQHIPYREDKGFVGTSRFCSLNAHAGCEQSRRDDLEALAYVLIYLARGSLPWQGQRAPRSRLNRRIGKYKRKMRIVELCEGLPKAFAQLLRYARSLEFEQEPDYAYCRAMFTENT
jgi:serine/threonine protein kinase